MTPDDLSRALFDLVNGLVERRRAAGDEVELDLARRAGRRSSARSTASTATGPPASPCASRSRSARTRARSRPRSPTVSPPSTASRASRSRGPASSTSGWMPPPPGRSRRRSSTRAPRSGTSDSLARQRSHQPRVRLGEPHRAAAHRPHPLGGARRLDRPRASRRGRRRSRTSTTSTTRAARWTLRIVGARRGQGGADPRGRLCRQLHRRSRRPGARARAQPARARRHGGAACCDRDRLRPAARRDPRLARAVQRALRRLVQRAASAGHGRRRPLRRRQRRRAAARAGPRLRRGRRGLGAHDRLRRRQGSGHPPLQRRLHVLRRRCRVLPQQGRPRLRRTRSTCSAPTTTATCTA